VTHRVGMNAAIDDVDFGIRRGAILSLRAGRPAPRSVSTAPRAGQSHVACLNSSTPRRIVGQRAAAYGGRLRSKVGRCGGRPAKQSVESGAAK
jgi:hypothetical protein